MYSVYVHTCPNGKKYIGMTGQNNPKDRWQSGHGYKHCTDFHNAIIEFGWRNISHEVISTGLSKEEAEFLEQKLISLYKTQDPRFGYNSHSGGLSGQTIRKETVKRMSKAQSGEGNPRYGVHLSQETKEKIASTKRGKPLSAECKKKLSKVFGGDKNPQAKSVCQYDLNMNLIKIWPYMNMARFETGASNISECCRGRLKTSGGFIWRYFDGGD